LVIAPIDSGAARRGWTSQRRGNSVAHSGRGRAATTGRVSEGVARVSQNAA
jgi:hypothetical protein